MTPSQGRSFPDWIAGRTNALISICLLFAVSANLFGCGGTKGPQTATFSGKVTYGGDPLEAGSISFVPSDGIGPSSGGQIEDGNYTVTVPLGEKRVVITSPFVLTERPAYAGVPDSPMIKEYGELIPAKYNSQTELKMAVVAGKNSGDFTLETATP